MMNTLNPSPYIVDATVENFQSAVIERSRELPVVVDFWAEWCQPCKLLAPLLEKLAREMAGRFLLAKVNVDKLPDIAAAFGVQSIPAVFAVRDGQLLDMFVGVLPEPQLRTWLERLLPSPAETLVKEARQLLGQNSAEAEVKFREATRLDPSLADAQIGLAQVLIDGGQLAAAAEVIAQLESRGFLEPEAEKQKARLSVEQLAGEAGDVAACRAAVAANPTDQEARFKLTEALAAARQYEEALRTALELIQANRAINLERCRKLMVDVFQILPDSEMAATYRRRLSQAMY